ncbi:DUF2723 domain-containing protein, partial [bacterium]|nr:DUF2723 domain-containing protein [bacterium]
MATANRGSSNLTASGPAAAAPAAQTQPSLWSWFHPINWITALITYAISFSVYVYTLQPTVGLEDSGELIAGAYRLGVPHPPGYPLWTIVAKLFTFIPVGDPAWRVNLFSAVCGALAASFVTLVLAKSGDLLFAEQEEELGRHHLLPVFERIGLTTPRLVNSLCAITAGVLFAMTPGTWSQSTIAEVYAFNAFFMALVVLLSLVLMFNPQRRNVFIWITVAFALGITVHQTIVVMIIALGWLAWSTRKSYEHFFNLAVNAVILAAFAYYWFNETPYHLSPFNITDAKTFWSKGWFFTHFIGAFVVYLVAAYAVNKYWFRMTEWPKLASAFLASLCVYFYLPVASASNPCMNWGRARTVEGFWHSICRGQYEKPSFKRHLGYFTDQVMLYLKDTWDQYPMTLIFAFVSILALVLVWRKTRLRDWLIYSVLAFLGCGIGMVFLMNPKLDITSQYINRVFFIMGHAGLGLLVGYGMITVAVALFSISRRAEHVWRHVALAIGAVFVAYGGIFALCSLQKPSAAGPLGRIARSISVPPEMHFAFYALFGTLFMLIGVFVIAGVLKRRVSHAASVGIALCVLMTPFIPAIENWDEQNLRSKYFGFVFGVEMMKVCEPNTIFFGGTDPGRFVPEYMCGCSEFRADIYLITQNGLADATYMNVLRDRFCKPKHVWPWARKLLGLLNADREDYKEGVNTIYIPSQEDFERAFQIYIKQVEERRKRGEQIEEDVRIEGGKVSVGGVAGVMRLNGILAEMIWSNNTNKHAFYVEESYVIPWMYPYLEPAGLIMKLNASPVTLTPEKVAKDVAYWNNLEKMFTEGGHIDYEDINVAPEGGVIINNSGKYNFVDRRAKRKGRIVIEKGEFADDVTAQKSFSKARSAS